MSFLFNFLHLDDYTAAVIFHRFNANDFHDMTQSEWFMLGHVCKVGIILIFHPFDLEWKREMLSEPRDPVSFHPFLIFPLIGIFIIREIAFVRLYEIP